MRVKFFRAFCIVVALLFIDSAIAAAQGTSSGYRIDESYIGPGGALQSQSSTYTIDPGQQALQGASTGESSSASFTTKGGSTTTADPSLTCGVNTSTINFGAFSTSTASTATATFSVLNYTSAGYIVSIVGQPPKQGSRVLNALATQTTSSPGTEQFGINLVANTSPTTFGADPVQVPSSSFSFGAAASNYNTANQFRYVSGDTIASSVKSSGQTNYTISYLVNVATSTPGGTYSGGQTIVCTGTY
jgi:hypothetical protein